MSKSHKENVRWHEVERVFDAALEVDTQQRATFIEIECGNDTALRHEVETLVDAYGKAAGFLVAPAQQAVALKQALAPTPAGHGANGMNEMPGVALAACLGPYRLIRELAQGGMGTVWLAERADKQFQQQVAIKLLKAEAVNEEALHRFRHERQVLAELNHPNIARLLDGGTTTDGRPYIVMEYIEGMSIDEYCLRQQLSLNECLQLFRQVCAAVQYAHQHLLIHRDLKPSNILVTTDGTPKLLDFGIAKLLQPDLLKSYDTITGLQPMTPAYASPEQVRGEKLTTASDVYSLGVVLYELLTGRSPYQLQANTFGELIKAICEQEPVRLSVAVTQSQPSKDEGRGSVNHHTHPTTRNLKGDLDSIVLMALRKEPVARYSSVEQFSDDLRRYLEGLPTHARKGTFGYHAVKYVRRYKVPVAAAVLLLFSLVGGIGATSRQAQIARAEQAKAESQRIRAEQALAVADEQRRLAEQALAEVKAQRTRAENALTTAEQRRQQAEAARIEANQQRAAAVAERNMAQTQRKLADEQRQRAETQELSNRQLLYTSRMGLTQQAWESGNIGRMRELLNLYLPQAGAPDFRGFDWFYLWRLCHLEEKTIAGGDFNAVAYAPDGKMLITLAITRNNKSHTAEVAFRDSFTAEVAFRDAQTWQTLSSQQYNSYSPTGKIAVSRNTDKVVVGSDSIRVFSFSDYKEHLQISGVELLRSVAISPSGKIIAAGSYKGKIQLFDAATGKEMRTLIGHRQQINTVAFSPDEQILLSGSWDETVRLWDVGTGNEIRAINQRKLPLAATFTADGNAIIVASIQELKVWEAATGREIATRSITTGGLLALSQDGKTLATAGSQNVIRLWDTQLLQEKAAIKGHGNIIQSLAFSPDGKYLASGSRDQTTRIWNLNNNTEEVITLTDTETQSNIMNALFTPNGQKIISTSPGDLVASIWDNTSGRKLLDLRGHTKPATANAGSGAFVVAVSSDSRLIATGGPDNLVKIWESETGREIRTISNFSATSVYGTASPALSLAFSPDNNLLVIGCVGEARIYDLAQGRETVRLNLPGYVNELSFFSDGNILVTAGDEGTMRFWNPTTGRELRVIQCKQSMLVAMALSANEKYLATGAADGTAAVWDVHTGNQVWLLKGHSSSVGGVSFSPDGKRLATSSGDSTVRLWDLITGQELFALKNAANVSVQFSPDGTQLLSAHRNSLKIWPAATEQEVSGKKD